MAWQKSLLPSPCDPQQWQRQTEPLIPLLGPLPCCPHWQNSRIHHPHQLLLQKNWVRKTPSYPGPLHSSSEPESPQQIEFGAKLSSKVPWQGCWPCGCSECSFGLAGAAVPGLWDSLTQPLELAAAGLGAGLLVTRFLWELIPLWSSSALCLCRV